MNQPTEIKAIFFEEKQRWENTIIAFCRMDSGKDISIKTVAEEGELIRGLTYNFYGKWKNHVKYGEQFEAASFIQVQPHDKDGIIYYLQRAPGVGRVTAKALWSKYQGDAVRILRENPENTAFQLALKHFSYEKAKEASAFLETEKGIEDATIDLLGLLSGRGFPRAVLKKSLRKWGNRAAQNIRMNPFLLLNFKGCGFIRTDTMWLELGKNPTSLKRQTLCIWYAMESSQDGHTWFHPLFVERALSERIASASVKAVRAARLGLRSGLLAMRKVDGVPWLTESSRAAREREVADAVVEMAIVDQPPWKGPGPGSWWPSIDDLAISDHQKAILAKALKARIGIFGGCPGTGKTYSAAKLIGKIVKENGEGSVAVIAPTGKAAVRISEAMAAHGLPLKAKTIHSFLGVSSIDEEGGGFAFQHNESNPVDEKYIIVDESSMIDISLMASLLKALPDNARLLLVGDINQLPPVGYGAPLRDLLAAGIHQGELTEIRRNSGAIVETCSRIRNEQQFDCPDNLNLSSGGNLILKTAREGIQSVEIILKTINNIKSMGLEDPVWGCQVIVAVNEKSALSRVNMNRALQLELNSANRANGIKFWPQDKIVCLKNSFWPVVPGGGSLEDEELVREKESGGIEAYIANGELGKILEVFPNKLIAEFFNPRRIVLIPKGENGDIPFDLGYAISCHKSQGSEWPIVIVAIDDYGGAKMICDRSWVYTAISRAKKACIMVGRQDILMSMVRRQKIDNRKSFLVERIKETADKWIVRNNLGAAWNPQLH